MNGQVKRIINITKGEESLDGDTVRYSSVNDIEKDVNIVPTELHNIRWTSLGIQETAESLLN